VTSVGEKDTKKPTHFNPPSCVFLTFTQELGTNTKFPKMSEHL